MKSSEGVNLSDEQLIAGYLTGNGDYFGTLYSRYYNKVYAKCYSFSHCHDDAFDLTQEILLKAICNSQSFAGNSKFSTWLYSIATNYCITQTIKKNKVNFVSIYPGLMVSETESRDNDLEERLRREEVEEKLDDYLAQLSPEEREILILKYRKNYSIIALQEEYNLSASAVKMRLLRARNKMSQLLKLTEAA